MTDIRSFGAAWTFGIEHLAAAKSTKDLFFL